MDVQKTATKEGGPQTQKLVRHSRPVVRQTLTSMYRLAKANPLLWLDDGKKDKELGNMKLPRSVTNFSYLSNTQLELNGASADAKKPLPTKDNANMHPDKRTKKHVDKKLTEPATGNLKTKTTVLGLNRNGLAQNQKLMKPPPAQTKKNFVLSNKHSAFNRGDKQRVSLTSQYRKKQQMKGNLNKQEPNANPRRRSKSAESFRPVQPENISQSVQSLEDITKPTLFENKEMRKVTFQSPVSYNRRSFFTTPHNRRMNFYSSTPRPAPNNEDLKIKLNEWLRKRGKSFSSFHHLKCFNVECESDEENKENIEMPMDLRKDESYEDLKIEKKDEIMPVKIELKDFCTIIKDALQDLLKLIQDGYSQDQCEAWLAKIRQKYHDLDEEPQYWECRAALEQSKGNIAAAVDCYRSAIVKGAEVQTVDESLERLLQKFSLFNINMEEANEETEKKAKIVLDARNVFKSTIIQFAIQEKKMKKKDDEREKQFVVVTPVRRSARLSTPGRSGRSAVRVCSTLKELEGEKLHFKNNSFLSARYAPI